MTYEEKADPENDDEPALLALWADVEIVYRSLAGEGGVRLRLRRFGAIGVILG